MCPLPHRRRRRNRWVRWRKPPQPLRHLIVVLCLGNPAACGPVLRSSRSPSAGIRSSGCAGSAPHSPVLGITRLGQDDPGVDRIHQRAGLMLKTLVVHVSRRPAKRGALGQSPIITFLDKGKDGGIPRMIAEARQGGQRPHSGVESRCGSPRRR